MTDTITAWLNSASKARRLDKEQTMEKLVQLGKTSDQEARTKLLNEICESNLLLVADTVKKFVAKRVQAYWNNEKTLDLLQQGYFGLRRAAEKFDATKGNQFSTYAVVWIRQAIGRWYDTQDNMIYVPEGVVKEVFHEKTHGKPSGNKRVTKDRRLIAAAAAALNPTSLDVPINDEVAPLHETLPYRRQSSSGDSTWARERLESALERAGIKGQVADLVLAYAKGGVLQIAAYKVGVPREHARAVVNGAIEQMRALA